MSSDDEKPRSGLLGGLLGGSRPRRRRRAFGDDDDDSDEEDRRELREAAAAHRREKVCTWVTVLIAVGLVVAFVVMASYSTNRASRLWAHYVGSRNSRRYCLSDASIALDAPSVSPYGVGTATLDARHGVIGLDVIFYGLHNATAAHIYGPLEPGLPEAPVAIALSSDITNDYVPLPGGSGRLRVKVRPLQDDDIDTVFADPVLYYVGLSTLKHPRGTALRFPLGNECNP